MASGFQSVKHVEFLWLWRWITIHGSVAWNLTLFPHTHPLCLIRFRRFTLPTLILSHNLQVACKILLLNNIICCVCCCLQFIALPHHFTTELQGWTELNRVQLPWKSIHSHVTTTPVSLCVCFVSCPSRSCQPLCRTISNQAVIHSGFIMSVACVDTANKTKTYC